MSRYVKEEIKCPKCGEQGHYDRWASVNVDLDPELREKIFNEELFMWQCSHCGAKALIPYDVLYHNMKQKLMIFFTYQEPREGKYKPLDITTLPIHDGYTMRRVFGLYRFKEKIAMLEDGLNDIAVEILKYRLKYIARPEFGEKNYELFYMCTYHLDKNGKKVECIEFYYRDENDQAQTISVGKDAYDEIAQMCEADITLQVQDCRCVDEGAVEMMFGEDLSAGKGG